MSPLVPDLPHDAASTENGKVAPCVVVLGSTEWRLLFEEEVRDELGIDAVEFVRRYRAGAYEDCDDPTVELLSISIPMYEAIQAAWFMSGRMDAFLDASLSPIIRALSVISATPVIVIVSPPMRDLQVRVAEIRLSRRGYLELTTNRNGDPLRLGFRMSVLIGPDAEDGEAVAMVQQGCAYHLFQGDSHSELDELVAYHAMLEAGVTQRLWPHPHSGSASLEHDTDRDAATLRTALGAVSANAVADFVRLLIEDFGIQPVVADWREQLVEDDVRS